MRKISTQILLTLLIFMLAACAGTAVETTTVVSESQQTAVLDEAVSTTISTEPVLAVTAVPSSIQRSLRCQLPRPPAA